MSMTLDILGSHQNVIGWRLVLIYTRTPPTHYHLGSSGRAAYMVAIDHSTVRMIIPSLVKGVPLTSTGKRGEETLSWPDLYLWVSSIKKAKSAHAKLTHTFPKKSIRSPMIFTAPTLKILLIINPVAFPAAPQKPFPLMAICTPTSFHQPQ